MAQGYYEGYQPPHSGHYASEHDRMGHGAVPAQGQAGGGVGRLVNLVGAVVSVALVVGVGVWSYRLMVRDVTGVPVIRALAGPARVSPEDPGGRQAAYQGLAVNSVAAEGEAAGAAESIALAPQPTDLSDEDRSTAVLVARGQSAIAAPAPAATNEEPIADAVLAAVRSVDTIEVQPAQTTSAVPFELIPASVPGVSTSPIPRRRDAAVIAAAAPVRVAPVQTAAATAPAGAQDAQAEALLQELVTRLGAPQVTDIDPTSLTAGTRLVQLGVYDDEAGARGAWDRISGNFPSFLEGRGRIVEPATAGGRVFYRLRAAGFADEPEARRFCTMLVAEGIDCIPTLIR